MIDDAPGSEIQKKTANFSESFSYTRGKTDKTFILEDRVRSLLILVGWDVSNTLFAELTIRTLRVFREIRKDV